MSKNAKEKNYAIEFYRFLFSILVVFVHCSQTLSPKSTFWRGAYVSVEFFFILSGFLMYNSLNNYSETKSHLDAHKVAFGRLKKRYKTLILPTLFSFFLIFLLLALKNKYSLDMSIQTLFNSFWELSLLYMNGLGDFPINAVTWYISALIIAEYFITFLFVKNKSLFVYFFAPLIIFLVYGRLYNVHGNIAPQLVTTSIGVREGTLRAFAGVCLGFIAYELYKVIKNQKFTKFAKILFSILDISLLSIIIINFYRGGYTKKDFLFLPAFAILVISAFTQNSFIVQKLNNKISKYLGNISIYIYLNHVFFRNLLSEIFLPNKLWLQFLYITLVTILFAIIFDFIANKIKYNSHLASIFNKLLFLQ